MSNIVINTSFHSSRNNSVHNVHNTSQISSNSNAKSRRSSIAYVVKPKPNSYLELFFKRLFYYYYRNELILHTGKRRRGTHQTDRSIMSDEGNSYYSIDFGANKRRYTTNFDGETSKVPAEFVKRFSILGPDAISPKRPDRRSFKGKHNNLMINLNESVDSKNMNASFVERGRSDGIESPNEKNYDNTNIQISKQKFNLGKFLNNKGMDELISMQNFIQSKLDHHHSSKKLVNVKKCTNSENKEEKFYQVINDFVEEMIDNKKTGNNVNFDNSQVTENASIDIFNGEAEIATEINKEEDAQETGQTEGSNSSSYVESLSNSQISQESKSSKLSKNNSKYSRSKSKSKSKSNVRRRSDKKKTIVNLKQNSKKEIIKKSDKLEDKTNIQSYYSKTPTVKQNNKKLHSKKPSSISINDPQGQGNTKVIPSMNDFSSGSFISSNNLIPEEDDTMSLSQDLINKKKKSNNNAKKGIKGFKQLKSKSNNSNSKRNGKSSSSMGVTDSKDARNTLDLENISIISYNNADNGEDIGLISKRVNSLSPNKGEFDRELKSSFLLQIERFAQFNNNKADSVFEDKSITPDVSENLGRDAMFRNGSSSNNISGLESGSTNLKRVSSAGKNKEDEAEIIEDEADNTENSGESPAQSGTRVNKRIFTVKKLKNKGVHSETDGLIANSSSNFTYTPYFENSEKNHVEKLPGLKAKNKSNMVENEFDESEDKHASQDLKNDNNDSIMQDENSEEDEKRNNIFIDVVKLPLVSEFGLEEEEKCTQVSDSKMTQMTTLEPLETPKNGQFIIKTDLINNISPIGNFKIPIDKIMGQSKNTNNIEFKVNPENAEGAFSLRDYNDKDRGENLDKIGKTDELAELEEKEQNGNNVNFQDTNFLESQSESENIDFNVDIQDDKNFIHSQEDEYLSSCFENKPLIYNHNGTPKKELLKKELIENVDNIIEEENSGSESGRETGRVKNKNEREFEEKLKNLKNNNIVECNDDDENPVQIISQTIVNHNKKEEDKLELNKEIKNKEFQILINTSLYNEKPEYDYIENDFNIQKNININQNDVDLRINDKSYASIIEENNIENKIHEIKTIESLQKNHFEIDQLCIISSTNLFICSNIFTYMKDKSKSYLITNKSELIDQVDINSPRINKDKLTPTFINNIQEDQINLLSNKNLIQVSTVGRYFKNLVIDVKNVQLEILSVTSSSEIYPTYTRHKSNSACEANIFLKKVTLSSFTKKRSGQINEQEVNSSNNNLIESERGEKNKKLLVIPKLENLISHTTSNSPKVNSNIKITTNSSKGKNSPTKQVDTQLETNYNSEGLSHKVKTESNDYFKLSKFKRKNQKPIIDTDNLIPTQNFSSPEKEQKPKIRLKNSIMPSNSIFEITNKIRVGKLLGQGIQSNITFFSEDV